MDENSFKLKRDELTRVRKKEMKGIGILIIKEMKRIRQNELTKKADLTRQGKILGDCYVVTFAHKT